MSRMDLLRDILLFLHFLGLASLFGGLFVQVKADPRVVNNAMFHGILTQLVTGLLLVGVLEGLDKDVDNIKIGVKLVVALVIGVLIVMNRKKSSIPNGLYFALMGLTVLNIGVAVFWH
jgi:FtsH-binding integral membrane protein